MRALASLGLLLLLPGHAQAAVEHRVSGLQFEAPDEAEVTRHTLNDTADAIAITRGEEGLVLTVYQGKKAPTAARALKTHLAELEARLVKGTVKHSLEVAKEARKLLGRRSRGRFLSYRKHYAGGERAYVAHLNARRTRGLTVVTLWSAPAAANQGHFSPALLTSLVLTKRLASRS